VGGLKLEEGLSVPSKSEGLPYEDSGRLTISIKRGDVQAEKIYRPRAL